MFYEWHRADKKQRCSDCNEEIAPGDYIVHFWRNGSAPEVLCDYCILNEAEKKRPKETAKSREETRRPESVGNRSPEST